jgi:hypothetical protein
MHLRFSNFIFLSLLFLSTLASPNWFEDHFDEAVDSVEHAIANEVTEFLDERHGVIKQFKMGYNAYSNPLLHPLNDIL